MILLCSDMKTGITSGKVFTAWLTCGSLLEEICLGCKSFTRARRAAEIENRHLNSCVVSKSGFIREGRISVRYIYR
jgi:hypothetical protein